MSPLNIGCLIVTGWMLTVGAVAHAESPAEIQRGLEMAARQGAPGFVAFSPQRGEQLFKARHGDWSCASCHGPDPLRPGRHVRTGKVISPLAPAADPERFTSTAKVEKWFARNCNDVFGRACTPLEKGDVLAWLLSLGR